MSVVVLVVVAGLVAVAGAGQQLTPGAATGEALWHGPAGLALTAAFGVALGALLRNQVVAISVTLLYVMLGETLVNQFAPEVAPQMCELMRARATLRVRSGMGLPGIRAQEPDRFDFAPPLKLPVRGVHCRHRISTGSAG